MSPSAEDAAVPRLPESPSAQRGHGAGLPLPMAPTRSQKRSNSVPIIVRVHAAAAERAELKANLARGLPDLLNEKEKAKLISLTEERDVLKQENQSLNTEVARLRRNFRAELHMQRAELAALKAEREELRQLALEAKRLLSAKETLVSRSGGLSPAGMSPATSLRESWDLMSDEDLQAAERLASEHSKVVQRFQKLDAGAGAAVFVAFDEAAQRPTRSSRQPRALDPWLGHADPGRAPPLVARFDLKRPRSRGQV